MKILTTLMLSLFVFTIVGCQEPTAGDKIRDTGDAIGDAVKDVGDSIEDTVENVKD